MGTRTVPHERWPGRKRTPIQAREQREWEAEMAERRRLRRLGDQYDQAWASRRADDLSDGAVKAFREEFGAALAEQSAPASAPGQAQAPE